VSNSKQSTKQSIKRSLSRLVAVQSLYQYNFYQSDKDLLEISKQLLENYFLSEEEEKPTSYLDKIDTELLESLLSGIILALENIDEEIKSFLKDEWRAEDMPDLMMPILRLASFELKFMKDTPTKVIISEYVDLAACYYEEKKVNFINKVLQNIADKNR
jgi:transcription antitermination protein NusB